MTGSSLRADQDFADLMARAQADPAVQGLVLHGSRVFEGMVTARSDYDVFLITTASERGPGWQDQRSSTLDLGVMSMPEFRSAVLDGGHDNRYILAHARVLLDRLDGQVAALLQEAATLPRA